MKLLNGSQHMASEWMPPLFFCTEEFSFLTESDEASTRLVQAKIKFHRNGYENQIFDNVILVEKPDLVYIYGMTGSHEADQALTEAQIKNQNNVIKFIRNQAEKEYDSNGFNPSSFGEFICLLECGVVASYLVARQVVKDIGVGHVSHQGKLTAQRISTENHFFSRFIEEYPPYVRITGLVFL